MITHRNYYAMVAVVDRLEDFIARGLMLLYLRLAPLILEAARRRRGTFSNTRERRKDRRRTCERLASGGAVN